MAGITPCGPITRLAPHRTPCLLDCLSISPTACVRLLGSSVSLSFGKSARYCDWHCLSAFPGMAWRSRYTGWSIIPRPSAGNVDFCRPCKLGRLRTIDAVAAGHLGRPDTVSGADTVHDPDSHAAVCHAEHFGVLKINSAMHLQGAQGMRFFAPCGRPQLQGCGENVIPPGTEERHFATLKVTEDARGDRKCGLSCADVC